MIDKAAGEKHASLQHPLDDIIELSGGEAAKLKDLAMYLTADPTRDPEIFCREAKRAAEHMPRGVKEQLWDFGRRGSKSGALLISGVPIGDIPSTPENNRRHIGEKTVMARIQAMINETLGAMVAYEAEGAGRMFQDMAPSADSVGLQTSLSSGVELELHTEQAFSDLRPDFLSLGCLRGDPQAFTYLYTARDILASCAPDTVKVLRASLWHTEVDISFREPGSVFAAGDVRGPLPIISGAEDDPFVIFDQDLMRGVDEAAQKALRTVVAGYYEGRRSISLQAGQILVLDNRRCVHGRSSFPARFDGTDRFLIRSFAIVDLHRTRYARPDDGRMIARRYS